MDDNTATATSPSMDMPGLPATANAPLNNPPVNAPSSIQPNVTPVTTDGDDTIDMEDVFSDNKPAAKQPAKQPANPATQDSIDNANEPETEIENDNTEQQPKVESEEETKVEEPSQKPFPSKRDYTAFNEDDKKLLSKLPNQIFAKVSERLKQSYAVETENNTLRQQNAQLKQISEGKGIPDQWYQSPDAYRLSPQFNELSARFDRATFEEQHWQEQLTNAKAGQPIVSLRGYDQQGNPVYGEPFAATPQTEVQLMRLLQAAGMKKAEFQNEAISIKQQFDNSYKQAHSFIDVAKQKFSSLPKDLQPKEEHVKTFMQQIPAAYQNSPAMLLAASIYSIACNQEAIIKTLQKANQNTTKNSIDAKRAGPRVQPQAKAGLAKNAKSDTIDFADLEREMNS